MQIVKESLPKKRPELKVTIIETFINFQICTYLVTPKKKYLHGIRI